MKKRLLIFILTCFVLQISYAQGRIITGSLVSGDTKEALVGASVVVLKSSQNTSEAVGVITDLDGKFSVKVSDDAKFLSCSYLGYKTQAVPLLANKDNYHIVLEPEPNSLEGVVVTGYQKIEKRKLTAAITTLNVSDETVGTITSLDQALIGQIPGVSAVAVSGSPTAPVRIRIRGTASLNGTQDPLWVLDGIPLEGTDIPKLEDASDLDNLRQSSIAGLSPADIDNITILKDAAATAIYGARAANGVIVITTKKGREGKLRVNFSSKFTYSPKMPIDRLNLLNADQKVGLELDLLKSLDFNIRRTGEVSRILNENNLLYDYMFRGWDILPSEVQNEINALRKVNTDWNDILFRDALNQEYNVNVSGGSEKVKYYNSFSYLSQEGNVRTVSSDRFNLVSKIDYTFNNFVNTKLSLFANHRRNKRYSADDNGIVNPLYYSRMANPYQKVYEENGDYIYDYNIQNGDSDLKFNIFEESANSSNVDKTTGINAIWELEFKFTEKLKFSSQLGVQMDKISTERFSEQETFVMRSMRDRTVYQGSSFLPDGGMISNTEMDNSQITWKGMGEYRDVFNGMQELELMVGSEIRKTWSGVLNSKGFGFDRKSLITQSVIFPDESRAFSLYSKDRYENAYTSFFGTASYTLLKKYTLAGSIRFDGSDLFGVDKKYRYLPLYSVSGAWRISEESLFKSEDSWLNDFTVRASYGLQGNIDKNTSPYLLGKYDIKSILPGSSEQIININSAPNNKLRWEKTTSINTGFNLSMLNSAVNLSLDYYYRKGTDLIGARLLPLETGFVSTNINWASVSNKGIEINLSTRNITTKTFSWYTHLNFAYNQSRVLKEKPQSELAPSKEGYSVGAIFGFKTDGLDEDGLPLFINKEGKKVTVEELFKLEDEWGIGLPTSGVTPSEIKGFYSYLGTSDAPYTGGIVNTFRYKNLELSCNIAYYLGAHVKINPPYLNSGIDLGKNTSHEILDRWTPENKGSNLPAIFDGETRVIDFGWYGSSNTYRELDIWVKKQNYFRIQTLRLGYMIPKKILDKFSLNSATLALEGRNLFVLGSSYKNYLDPETMGNRYATPIPKMFIFSLNLSF